MELDFIEGDDFSDDWDDEVEEETTDENDESSDDELLTDLPEGMDEVLKNIEKYSKESYDDEETNPNVISTEVQRSGEISATLDGVETSKPQCHPESVAKRSREDLNPNVMSTEVETSNPNVILSVVQRSRKI